MKKYFIFILFLICAGVIAYFYLSGLPHRSQSEPSSSMAKDQQHKPSQLEPSSSMAKDQQQDYVRYQQEMMILQMQAAEYQQRRQKLLDELQKYQHQNDYYKSIHNTNLPDYEKTILQFKRYLQPDAREEDQQ